MGLSYGAEMKSKSKRITLVIPYYDNAGMLIEHFSLWSKFNRELIKSLSVIVVDDCSPNAPALDCIRRNNLNTSIVDFKLYRCLVDVRWNWLFCRNLAVAEANTDWVLLTDIDHALPEQTLRCLSQMKHDSKCVYRLSRRDAPNLSPYKPHPNTWFMTREMFYKIGGYDERFSGFYGSDGEFRDRVVKNAAAVPMLSEFLIRYPREVIADASTTTYGRKEQQDHDGIIAARKRIAEEGGPIHRLTFPWERQI